MLKIKRSGSKREVQEVRKLYLEYSAYFYRCNPVKGAVFMEIFL